MKVNILLILLLGAIWCQAQTKPIAHKSHSGSASSFAKAYQNNLFDLNRSNFGLPGARPIIVLDSIIAVNDTLTILKLRKTNSCHQYGTSYKDVKDSQFTSRTDTIVNHEFLIKKYSEAFIRGYRKHHFPIGFQNPLEEVEFIGFKE